MEVPVKACPSRFVWGSFLPAGSFLTTTPAVRQGRKATGLEIPSMASQPESPLSEDSRAAECDIVKVPGGGSRLFLLGCKSWRVCTALPKQGTRRA
jgi:hypothetical protein